MKEILAREDKLASQNSVLITLAAGTQEEIKVSGSVLIHDLLAFSKWLFFVILDSSKPLIKALLKVSNSCNQWLDFYYATSGARSSCCVHSIESWSYCHSSSLFGCLVLVT